MPLFIQGGDDDDDHAPGNTTYDFSSAGAVDLSQTSAGSHSGFLNNSIFDATMLQGDKLVAQPHKVCNLTKTAFL